MNRITLLVFAVCLGAAMAGVPDGYASGRYAFHGHYGGEAPVNHVSLFFLASIEICIAPYGGGALIMDRTVAVLEGFLSLPTTWLSCVMTISAMLCLLSYAELCHSFSILFAIYAYSYFIYLSGFCC